MRVHAKTALLHDGWARDLTLTIRGGVIDRIESGASRDAGDTVVDTLLPAIGNLHSHAFQRAMAGMTEYRAAGRESFWTWRALMYRFLERLTPEDIRAISALVFMEMQEAGYAAVGEFHYVHHQPDGTPYDRLSELSGCVMEAAETSGIGLTHLPVLYTYGGVDGALLSGGQMRFANDVDRYLDLVAECREAARHLPPDTRVGIAPHSLRATNPADLKAVLSATGPGPIHIHIAEQQQEVDDVLASIGKRPIAWLLDNFDVDSNWCLIHATHMSDAETIALAETRAVAGLCPITEANLGDGIFNGATYLDHGGAFGIGSDSNVRISLTEELRLLEYSQRLRDRQRNVLVVGSGSVGHSLYTGAARGGAQALGRDAGEIVEGRLADLVAIDRTAPSLCALQDDQLLDGLCFAASDDVVTDLWSAGRHMVRDGRHVHRDRIVADYRRTMARVAAAS